LRKEKKRKNIYTALF